MTGAPLLPPAARAVVLERLARATTRGFDLPLGLALAKAGVLPKHRAKLELAEARAGEGAPLADVLVAGRLVSSSLAPLVRASEGGQSSYVLGVLAREARDQVALRESTLELLIRPLGKVVGVVLVVLFLLVAVDFASLPATLNFDSVGLGPGPPVGILEAIVAGMGIILLGLVVLKHSRRGRRVLEGVAQALPFSNRLVRLHSGAVFLNTVGVAVAAGADAPAAMRHAKEAFRGRLGEESVDALVAATAEGMSLVDALIRAPFLGPTDRWLLESAVLRADLAEEILSLGALSRDRLALEARRWGPVFGGLAELCMLGSLAWFAVVQFLGPVALMMRLQSLFW